MWHASNPRLLGGLLAAGLLCAAVLPASAGATTPETGVPQAADIGEQQAAARRPQLPGVPLCSEHFCVHYSTGGPGGIDVTDADSSGAPDYAERVRDALEAAYSAQRDAGWPIPKADGTLGGDARIDAYIQDLGPEGLRGQAVVDPVVENLTDRGFPAYMRIDDTLDAPDVSSELADVVAHEYHHVVQQSVDAFQESWFVEAMASFVAQRGVGATRSVTLRGFMGTWLDTSTESITSLESDRQYGSAVFMHWLADSYGVGMLRATLERSPQLATPPAATQALQQALERRGGLSQAFGRFGAATAEWGIPRGERHPRGLSIGESLPDLPRQGSLRRGARVTLPLDHLSFQHFRLAFRGRRTVTLTASGPRAVNAAIALTARYGPKGAERVRTVIRPFNGSGTLVLRVPPDTRRMTATIIDTDFKRIGYEPGRGDGFVYRDAQAFTLRAP